MTTLSRLCVLSCIFFFLLLLTLPLQAVETADWTFIVYMAADNDLAPYALEDLNEMEMAGSPTNCHQLVMLDICDTAISETDTQSGCRIYKIQKDDSPWQISSPVVRDLGIQNTGNQDLLTDFIKFAAKSHPAKHYCLWIWNHGSGWKTIPYASKQNSKSLYEGFELQENRSIAYDDGAQDSLTLKELGLALKNSAGNSLTLPLDIIVYDACLMQMAEVATETGPFAKWIIGSEEIAPQSGHDHGKLFSYLKTKAPTSAKQLSETIVTQYMKSYSKEGRPLPTAISLLNSENLDRFNAEMKNLTNLLSQGEYLTSLRLADRSGIHFDDPEFVDLTQLLQQFKKIIRVPAVQTQIEATLKSLQNLVALNQSNDQRFKNYGGLSIYFPENNFEKNYLQLNFSQKTGWGDFLALLNNPSNDSDIQVVSLELLDDSRDGLLSPGEAARLSYTIQNNSTKKQSLTFSLKETGNFFTTNNSSDANSYTIEIPAGRQRQLAIAGVLLDSVSVKQNLQFELALQKTGGEVLLHKAAFSASVPHNKTTNSLLIVNTMDDSLKFVTNAYKAASISYDLWNMSEKGEITPRALKNYQGGIILRFLPETSGRYTFSHRENERLVSFLKDSGRLILSGQDFCWTQAGGRLFQFLKIQAESDEGGTTTLKTFSNDTDIHFSLNGSDSADNQFFMDTLKNSTSTQTIFEHLFQYLDPNGVFAGNAGILVKGDGYRVAALGFGLEGITSLKNRVAVIKYLYQKLDISVASTKIDTPNSSGERELLKLELLKELENSQYTIANELINQCHSTEINDSSHGLLQIIKEYVNLKQLSGESSNELLELSTKLHSLPMD